MSLDPRTKEWAKSPADAFMMTSEDAQALAQTALALEAELAALKGAAHALYDCHYRDVNVTERGRPTSHDYSMAVQELGEKLGVIGGPASASPDSLKGV
jgi:hypothetical protein